MNGQQQQIQVEADNETLKGKYSNNLMISHTKEEFVLDFMLIHPPKGLLTSRVLTSPGHAKRILAALADNIKKYESKFGTLQASEPPKSEGIGFKTA